MSDIYVFGPNDETNDYSSFGLVGALLPTEATFSEAGNGDSSVSLTCPLDEFGRYAALAKGNILLCPVPVRTTPEIQNGSCVTTVWTYKVKPLAQLTNKKQRTLYKKQKGSSRLKIMNAGDIVTVVLKPTSSTGSETRWKVKSQYGTGWIIPDGFELVTEKKIDNNANAIQEVQSPWTVQPQRFRIYEIEKTMDEVTVQARHISYDLLYNMTTYKSDESVTLQTALNGVLNNCINKDHGFTAYTNVANEQAGLSYNGKNPIDAMLDPEEGLCAKYKVNLIRDNDELFFLNDPGMNRGVKISYGKNMTGVSYTVSDDSVATRILPVGENKDGTPLYLSDTESERYIDSTRINDYPVAHVYQLDCDNCKVGQKDSNGSKVTVAVARARMKKQAEDLLATGVDLPTIKMEVEFVNLGDTEEYDQFKNLENCFLYDYLIIQYGKQNINVTAQIQEIEWDILTDMMKSVTIGTVGETLANMGITTWQIPTGFSGSKIANGTLGGGALREDAIATRHLQADSVNASVIAAHSITADRLDATTVNAMTIEAVRAKINELVAGQITTDQLYADLAKIAVAQITAANIDKANINWADIKSLTTEIADIANANIGTAKIDWAKIYDLTTDTAIITEGEAGKLYIARLNVTEANMVNLTVGELMLKAADGSFKRLTVDADGNVSAETVTVEGGNIANATISGGKIIENTITARELNVESIFADTALIRAIKAANIDVSDLFAASATVGALDAYIVKASTIAALKGQLDLWASDKITAAVGGVQIGGRNYLMGTSQPYTAESDGTERKWLFPWACASAETAKSLYGKTVTISFDYDKSIASGSFQILTNITWQGVVPFDAGTVSGQHFEKTFEINSTTDDVTATIIYIDGTWNGAVTFRNMKLEIGNKATDWSTAPEEVSIGSSIEMDKDNVRIATGNFDVDVTGDAGDLHIDENGLSADTATFNTLNCSEVVKYYTGAANVTLGAGGTYQTMAALADALNYRKIRHPLTVTVTSDIYGDAELSGIIADGGITFVFEGHSFNGIFRLMNCRARYMEFKNMVYMGPGTDLAFGIYNSGYIYFNGCTFNFNNNPADSMTIRYASNVKMDGCGMYNGKYFIYLADCAQLEMSYCLGGGCTNFLGAHGGIFKARGTRPDGGVYDPGLCLMRPSDPTTLVVNAGTSQGTQTPVTTASFTANVTGTYYPSGHWMSDNVIRQGHEGTGSSARRDYGCMWFDAGGLSGKTIKSTTLTIKRVAGKGRSGTVALKLWTTTVTGKSGVMASSTLTSVGEIGAIGNGETLTVSVPVSAISAIASGGGFVLYTEETANASGKAYSRNYAHIEGTGGSAPVLTVTYQ